MSKTYIMRQSSPAVAEFAAKHGARYQAVFHRRPDFDSSFEWWITFPKELSAVGSEFVLRFGELIADD